MDGLAMLASIHARKVCLVDRDPPTLLPPDPREWVRGDELAQFVTEAVRTGIFGNEKS
ncbi:MAG: hypothetical protein ABF391_13505 [Akkermansiaceae bacterium]